MRLVQGAPLDKVQGLARGGRPAMSYGFWRTVVSPTSPENVLLSNPVTDRSVGIAMPHWRRRKNSGIASES